MRAPAILAAALLAAVALLALRLRRQVEAEQGGTLPGLSFSNISEELQAMFAPEATPHAERNERAFLAMIRHAEGTADALGYSALFGHRASSPRTFNGWADHPRIAVQFTDAAGRRLWTSAAGAYQFMAVSPTAGGRSTRVDTWDRIKRRLSLPDFSPASQDRAALALIDEQGALSDVRAGRFEAAVRKVAPVWASLPGAGYSQPERKLAELEAAYINAGGTFA